MIRFVNGIATRVLIHRVLLWTISWLLAAAVTPAISQAQPLGAQLLGTVPGGISGSGSKTGIQRAPGRSNDLFVTRLDGTIFRVDLTTNNISPFVTLPAADIDLTGQTGFFGLLGLAFAPDFQTSRQIYVHMSDERNVAPGVHHRTYIRRYTLDSAVGNSPAIVGAGDTILRFDQPGHDHKGGFLGFQPNNPNILWITSGDGLNNDGNPNPSDADGDGIRSGQDTDDLLGSILRIDVSGDDFPADTNRDYRIPSNNPKATGNPAYGSWLPELWSIGHRSPWGASFDRATGDFIVGEVGQVTREEINFQRFDPVTGYDSAAGRNYGWRVMEGNLCANRAEYAGNECNEPGFLSQFTAPILDYEHTGGYGGGDSQPFEGRSITGGYVYRGPVTELQGKYIFADWSSRQVWAVEIDRNANGGLGGIVGLAAGQQCEDVPTACMNLTSTFNRPVNPPGGGDVPNAFGRGVTAFGEDEVGNLYFMEAYGDLFKIVGAVPEPTGAILMLLGWAGMIVTARRRAS